jgi:hypothetical protein
MWTGFIWFRIMADWLIVGSYEHNHEPSGITKNQKVLDYVSGHQLLKEGSTPWSSLLIILMMVTTTTPPSYFPDWLSGR